MKALYKSCTEEGKKQDAKGIEQASFRDSSHEKGLRCLWNSTNIEIVQGRAANRHIHDKRQYCFSAHDREG
jgi:hypothetical protein